MEENHLVSKSKVSYHRTDVNRQVKEAIRIRRRGGANNILNSRSKNLTVFFLV